MNLYLNELPIIASILLPILGSSLLVVTSLGVNRSATKLMRILIFLTTITALVASIFYITHVRYCNIERCSLGFQINKLSQFGSIFVLLTAIVTVLQLWDHLHQEGWVTAKPLSNLLLASSGMVLLSTTNNTLLIFLTITLMYTQIHALTTNAGIRIDTTICNNHYLIIGVIISVLFLIGSILLYISTNSFDIATIGLYLANIAKPSPITTIGLVSLILGFILSIDIVPMLKWTPKMYNTIPHPMAIFISVATNGTLILVFLRIMILNLDIFTILPIMRGLITILVGASIAYCSVLMISQTSIKWLLAYISSCHISYLILGTLAGTVSAHTGILFHLITYLIINAGIFGILPAFGLVGSEITLEQLRGLGRNKPILGASISLCVFSMAGLPPTAGFYSKYIIFKEIIMQGHTILAALVLASSLSLMYCCLRILLTLFVDKAVSNIKYELETKPAVMATSTNITVVLCGLTAIVLGIMPEVISNKFIPSIIREMTQHIL